MPAVGAAGVSGAAMLSRESGQSSVLALKPAPRTAEMWPYGGGCGGADQFQAAGEEPAADIRDQAAPAPAPPAPACAQPVGWTHGGGGAVRDSGPDAIQIDISWRSSPGNLADLGNCTV